jgi:hypothetical protein
VGCDPDEVMIWINVVKDSPKRQIKKLRKINGKFNNIGSANKKYINTILESLFENNKKTS